MLREINKSIWISKQTGRYMIIDCSYGAFSNDFGKYFHIPDFEYSTLMEILRMDKDLLKEEVEPYIKARAAYRKEKKTYYLNDKKIAVRASDLLNSDEKILYCTVVTGLNRSDIPWYIRLNKNISKYVTWHYMSPPYIGVHYRNTDKKADFDNIIKGIKEYGDKAKVVYLATDDCHAMDNFNKAIGRDYNIISFTQPHDSGGKNIHYGNPNKDEVILTALIDMWMLSQADYFVPSATSSFSIRVEAIRRGEEFFTK